MDYFPYLFQMSDYTFVTVLVQVVLAIALFFIVNSLGEKSVSIGYVQISMSAPEDSAPAFNFLFKVIAPIVFQILVVAVLEFLSLDTFARYSYMIIVYYWICRFIAIFLLAKASLTDWPLFIFYAFVSIILGAVIESMKNNLGGLLPDIGNIRDELWLLVILFIYQIINKMSFGHEKSIKRHERYIKKMYKKLYNKYHLLVESESENNYVQNIIFSLMIYENFNRPPCVRIFERLIFNLKRKEMTFGIMQVKSESPISDEESIVRAVKKIKEIISVQREQNSESFNCYRWDVFRAYNPGDYRYSNEIEEIFNVLFPDEEQYF